MRNYIPKQHGAWAMILLPFLFGMFAANPSWMHLPLGIGWLLVYLFTYPLLQFIRTGKRQLFMKPLLIYGVLLLPFAVFLIVMEPNLGWMALAFVPFFLFNCYFAKQNKERDFWNDVVAVIQFSSMVFIAYYIGGGVNWGMAMELFAVSVIYFMGTVFYVKTMIREKNNRGFYFFSIGYHICSLLGVGLLLHPVLLIPFALLLGRALILPGRKLTIKQVGVMEIAFSVMLALFVITIYAA